MAARVVLLLTVLIGAIYFNAEPAKASPHNIVVKQASLASLYGSVTFNITGYDRFNHPQGTEKCNTYKFDNGTLNSTLAGTIADPICDSGYSPVPGLYGTCVVYYGKHGHVAVHGWALPKGTICSKLLGTVKYRDGDNGNKTFVQCNKYNFMGGHYVAAGANQSVLPVCENKYISSGRHIATCVHNSHKNPGAGWFVPEGLPCIPLKGNTTTPRDDTPTPQCLEYSIPGGKYLTSNSNANKARYSKCDTGYTNHPGVSAVCTTLKDDDYAKFGWLLPDISSCLPVIRDSCDGIANVAIVNATVSDAHAATICNNLHLRLPGLTGFEMRCLQQMMAKYFPTGTAIFRWSFSKQGTYYSYNIRGVQALQISSTVYASHVLCIEDQLGVK
eukprot:scpid70939/ scgid15836/ 